MCVLTAEHVQMGKPGVRIPVAVSVSLVSVPLGKLGILINAGVFVRMLSPVLLIQFGTLTNVDVYVDKILPALLDSIGIQISANVFVRTFHSPVLLGKNGILLSVSAVIVIVGVQDPALLDNIGMLINVNVYASFAHAPMEEIQIHLHASVHVCQGIFAFQPQV